MASYFGTMGEANDLTQVVEAAALLRDRGERSVAFVLQGDGKRRAALEADVQRRGLDNVHLLPAGDKHSAARLAAASDACMTIFKDVPILATNSPNKLFDTFAAGRAAIVNTDGWQRELVERNEAGALRPRRATPPTWRTRCCACATIPSSPPAWAPTRAASPRPSSTAGCWPSGCESCWSAVGAWMSVDLSYCVVNTNGRDYLLACLDAIERTHPPELTHEVLVLDNCSDDGSVAAVEQSAPRRRA